MSRTNFQMSLSMLIDIRDAIDDAINAMNMLPTVMAERDELKRKYDELLSDSISASEKTAMGMLQLALHPKGGNQ